ncbi:MAG: DUF3306 domain-containing protein [Alphaproteobacteria bacterium]
MTGDEGFIGRWSQRKSQRKGETKREAPATRVEETAPPPDDRGGVAAPQDVAKLDLPDIESMSIDSDFSAFLQDGVPEELRIAALRRLWRLDPVFANLDGLLEYGGDFTDAATVVESLKTAYQVGRGFVDDEEEIAADAEEETEEVPADVANNSETSKKEHDTHENAKGDEPST